MFLLNNTFEVATHNAFTAFILLIYLSPFSNSDVSFLLYLIMYTFDFNILIYELCECQ